MNTHKTKRCVLSFCIFVSLCVLRGFLFPALAGTNGILEGTVKDRSTGETLSGVNVLILGTQQGASTSEDGRYVVHNVRAGNYDVRFTHIGYQSSLIKSVIINPDLRTRIHIQLEPSAVIMNEITVVQEKPLIQRDVTGTTFIVSGSEINLLPVDNVADVIRLKAGVTTEGNVRGGKTTEVLYLVDGLPVQDVILGGRSADLPNSSIVGLSFYTGGFEPEYGNALSGVVNIVTKTGTNQHKFFLRADKDNLFGGKQVSKTNEAEVSASGPVLEDQLYYFGSFTGTTSDTRWWQDFQYFVKSPVEKSYSGFGKLDYVFTPTMRLGLQALYAHRDWRDYEFNWRFNLDGLPPEKRDAYRIAAIYSHSPSESFFYTASFSRYYVTSKVGNGSKQDVPVNDPYQYDFFLRYVVDGQRTLWLRSRQETYTMKADGTFKAGDNHLMRFGAAMQLAENGYLFVNLGWYFQYPLFDYLYTGLDRVALTKGVSALTGNPDLDPERTVSFEIALKYSFDYNLVGSLTYFKKQSRNLIDTKTFIPGDSKVAGNLGFAEYVNTPEAQATGFELVISRERGEWLTGEVSYTYMSAEGTSGSAQDAFYLAQYGQLPAVRVFPLSWDQTHALKAVLTIMTPIDLNLNLVGEYHSGRPYTRYPTSTGFDSVKAGFFVQNNDRMPTYFNADIKVEKIFGFEWWENARMKLYLDVRNLTNAQNVKWVDSNSRVGGELGDPGGFYIGRRTSLGLQVEF